MTDASFLLAKAVAALVLPPTGPLLLALLGLLWLNRWPAIAKLLLWFPVIVLLLLSLPVTSRVLNDAMAVPRANEQQLKQAQVVVVLGAGITRATPEAGDVVNGHSLKRLAYGALLARRHDLPLLVSGGAVYGGQSEAALMAQTLRTQFNVTPRWVESRSRNTKENLRNAESLLAPQHFSRVLLVTEDYHMMRAMEECAATALHCAAAAVTTISPVTDSWVEELPSMDALHRSRRALHEVLGLVAQRYR